MSELLKTEFASLSAPGSTPPVRARAGAHTMAASIVGSGAVSFSGAWEGSNDLLAWSIIGAMNASGTASAAASAVTTTDFQYWRLNLQSVIGGNVSATVATDQSAGSGANQYSMSGDVNFPILLNTKSIVFGDSFSMRLNASLVDYRQSDHCYWTWANLLLGSPMTMVGNYGVGGETTTQMMSRVDAANTTGAGIVFVQGGINDFSAGATATSVVENLKTICTKFAKTALVVLLSIFPNASGTNATKVLQANGLLRRWAAGKTNVLFVDVYSSTVNSTDSTGAIGTGMSDDALHPSVKGARAMGVAIAAALTKFVPAVSLLPASAAESYAIDATCSQVVTNPLMSGSAGTVSGTGASGTLASSWLGGTDTGTVTSVWLHGQTRSDGVGVDQQVTITGAASGAAVNMRQASLSARFSAGDTIYACGSLKITGMTDVSRIQPYISATVNGTTYLIMCLDSSDTTFDQSDINIVWKTPEFKLTDAPSAVSLFIKIKFGTSGAGAAVMKIGRTGIYKVAS